MQDDTVHYAGQPVAIVVAARWSRPSTPPRSSRSRTPRRRR
ncbi:hypothetical protein [Actinomadura madurae]|nr:hypothetical protein [Actinomadura madurae]